jgi:hypothetical protein
MPHFRITFRKIVYGDTGRACTICQRIVEVEARDSASAQAAAMQSFCDLEGITDWLHHADWMEIERLQRTPAYRAIGDRGARRAA